MNADEPVVASDPVALVGNKAVEAAAIAYVMNLERAAGRNPIDRRYEAAFPADIESQPRLIEVKAAGGNQRGSDCGSRLSKSRKQEGTRISGSTWWRTSGKETRRSFASRLLAVSNLCVSSPTPSRSRTTKCRFLFVSLMAPLARRPSSGGAPVLPHLRG